MKYIDLIAISIDGDEETHDEIRNHRGAYSKMLDGIEVLKNHGKNFGFIHTLTDKTWDKLIALAEFAHCHGAKLFQIHPLELSGRALEFANEISLLEEHRHKAYILCAYLQAKYQNEMIVQLDLLHKDHVIEFPSLVKIFNDYENVNLITEIVDTISITEAGDILPFAHGFGDNYKIGSINNFNESIFSNYISIGLSKLKRLISATYMKVLNNETDVINWNEILIKESLL